VNVVDIAVLFSEHMLLGSLCSPPLRMTIETLVEPKDYQVEIADERFWFDNEMVDEIPQEETVGQLHVGEVGVEGVGCPVTEETLLLDELGCLSQDWHIVGLI